MKQSTIDKLTVLAAGRIQFKDIPDPELVKRAVDALVAKLKTLNALGGLDKSESDFTTYFDDLFWNSTINSRFKGSKNIAGNTYTAVLQGLLQSKEFLQLAKQAKKMNSKVDFVGAVKMNLDMNGADFRPLMG
jgi:hypothetical protein